MKKNAAEKKVVGEPKHEDLARLKQEKAAKLKQERGDSKQDAADKRAGVEKTIGVGGKPGAVKADPEDMRQPAADPTIAKIRSILEHGEARVVGQREADGGKTYSIALPGEGLGRPAQTRCAGPCALAPTAGRRSCASTAVRAPSRSRRSPGRPTRSCPQAATWTASPRCAAPIPTRPSCATPTPSRQPRRACSRA